jgi:murein L,D-transpeptidase YcbB/YkuD
MGNGDVTRHGIDRRGLLRLGASLAAPAILPRAAFAQGRLQASVPTLAPATVQLTERAVAHYESILARGGWPQVPVVDRLQLGNRHASVSALRTRLIVTGDLDAASGVTDIFDSYVENAVRHFQARHGLPADGVVREQTFAALNIPCELRVAQLQTNAVRLRSLSGPLGERYVLCNLPGAQIEAIENGIAVSRHTAVVGKPDRPSPNIVSKIVEINFNPFWTVPVSIVQRDLIKKMQDEPDYLEKNRIRIFDMRGHELAPSQINWYSNEATAFMFRQDPGDQNSLGAIRINFSSKDGVYMHDTPLKNLFGEDMRFHSSGCVRVENIRGLVDWLLRDTAGWARPQIDAVIRSGERRDARLTRPVPVYWVYITAWGGPDGGVQFREDIYNRDGLGPFAPAYTGSIAR